MKQAKIHGNDKKGEKNLVSFFRHFGAICIDFGIDFLYNLR